METVVIILVLIVIFGMFSFFDRTKYCCPKCNSTTFEKRCKKCHINLRYVDRMSDSSRSIEFALKYFNKGQKPKIIVLNNSVKVNMTPEELLEQEYKENVELIISSFNNEKESNDKKI